MHRILRKLLHCFVLLVLRNGVCFSYVPTEMSTNMCNLVFYLNINKSTLDASCFKDKSLMPLARADLSKRTWSTSHPLRCAKSKLQQANNNSKAQFICYLHAITTFHSKALPSEIDKSNYPFGFSHPPRFLTN